MSVIENLNSEENQRLPNLKMLINEIHVVYNSAHLFHFFYCLLPNLTSISSVNLKLNDRVGVTNCLLYNTGLTFYTEI